MLRKYFVIFIILSVVICSQCYSTESCAKLIDISAGEYHTLALDEFGGGAFFAQGSASGELVMAENLPATADIEMMSVEMVPAVVVEPMVVEPAVVYEPEPVDIEELINWLDEVWQNDEEVRNSITEEEYLEFRKSIEESEQY